MCSICYVIPILRWAFPFSEVHLIHRKLQEPTGEGCADTCFNAHVYFYLLILSAFGTFWMFSHRGKPEMDVVTALPILPIRRLSCCPGSHMEPTPRLGVWCYVLFFFWILFPSFPTLSFGYDFCYIKLYLTVLIRGIFCYFWLGYFSHFVLRFCSLIWIYCFSVHLLPHSQGMLCIHFFSSCISLFGLVFASVPRSAVCYFNTLCIPKFFSSTNLLSYFLPYGTTIVSSYLISPFAVAEILRGI